MSAPHVSIAILTYISLHDSKRRCDIRFPAPACHPLMAWMNIVCVGDWQLPLLPTTEHEKYAHWAVIWKLDFDPEYFALGQHESLQFGESLHFGPSWAIETAIGDCHVYSIYALETVLLNWISTWRCDTTLRDCCSCGPTRPWIGKRTIKYIETSIPIVE